MTAIENPPAGVDRLFARDPEALLDPYPIYERLRDEAPVLRFGPLVAVSKHADVIAVLRDPERFSSVRMLGTRVTSRIAEVPPEQARKLRELVDHEGLWLTETDRPMHTRLRGLANRAFTPRRIAAMRDQVQALTDGLLVEADSRGSMDLVAELAYPLPLRVVADMLGADVARSEDIREWSDAIAEAIGTDYGNIDAAYDALQNFTTFVTELIEQRRSSRGHSDLLQALIDAEEDGTQLSNDELVAMFVLLLFAGHETTTNLISNSVVALLRHPDQLALLRDDPALIRPATEEFLRYCNSVHAVHRVATVDTEIRGVPVHAGETVRVMIAAANHDADAFDRPDELDVRRADAAQHVGLGFGIHTCLGAWLLRLETEIVLTTLLARYPAMSMSGDLAMRPNFTLAGPVAVQLALR
jgi:cytochrome P450